MDACLTGQVVRVGQKQQQNQLGMIPNAACHARKDLLRGRATAKDPWEDLQGAGRRLDGDTTTTSSSATTAIATSANVEHLTEDEQLAMAISASMAETTRATTTDTTCVNDVSMNTNNHAVPVVTIPPEPAAGSPGAVRLQLKLPSSNTRLVRRFDTNDSVAVVAAVAAQAAAGAGGGQHRSVEVLAGFPPRPIDASLTIAQAGLANQSVQVRYV